MKEPCSDAVFYMIQVVAEHSICYLCNIFDSLTTEIFSINHGLPDHIKKFKTDDISSRQIFAICQVRHTE